MIETINKRRIRNAFQTQLDKKWNILPEQRQILFIVPHHFIASHDFWQFIESLNHHAKYITFVIFTEEAVIVPPIYVGQTIIINKTDLTWQQLPKKEIVEQVWSLMPDVLIDLHTQPFYPSLYLMSGASAGFSIGLFEQSVEQYFNFMFEVQDPEFNTRGIMQALKKHLSYISPKVLAFK